MDEFSFPYEPYGIQLQLMRAITDCLNTNTGGVGIFESPTGTGKSLSAICALMTWAEKFEQNERAELLQQAKSSESNCEKNDDDWIAAFRLKRQRDEAATMANDQLDKLKAIDERLRTARQRRSATAAMERQRKRRGPLDEILVDNDILPKLEEENDGGMDEIDKDLAPPEDYDSDTTCSDTKPLVDQRPEKAEEPLSCRKIFFCSRTHSQLEQLIGEIDKTRFKPRLITVGSRQALCANSDVKALKKNHLINERCMELLQGKSATGRGKKKQRCCAENPGEKISKSAIVKQSTTSKCPFAQSESIEQLTDRILTGELSRMTTLSDAGSKSTACPYFATRQALPLCELVLLPYQVLLNAPTRAAWGIDLKDNVVVIDEAHNLLHTLSSIHSMQLHAKTLEVGSRLVKAYIERFRNRLRAKNLMYMRQLQAIIVSLEKLLIAYSCKKEDDTVFTLAQFLTQLDAPDINLFKLQHYLQATNMCRKFHGFFMRYIQGAGQVGIHSVRQKAMENDEDDHGTTGIKKLLKKNAKLTDEPLENDDQDQQGQQQPRIASPMYQIKQFLEALTNRCEDARILVKKATANDENNSSPSFTFLLLNAAAPLKEIVTNARTTILLGGTMEPVGELMDALKGVVELGEEKIRKFSCGHCIDRDQLLAITIGKTPDNVDLTLNFTNRCRPEILKGLGMILMNFCRLIPNGAVVFMPSYDYLATFMQNLKSIGLYEKINAIKPVFIENRRDQSGDIWKKYCNAAMQTQGAVLFAIVGGKMSEGINFSDELGRCVIMLGLPYPNRQSVEWKEKMKYLDNTMGPGAGDRSYEAACMHSVNQAIGRAIRHRNDWSAIVLLDSRFSQPKIYKSLPHWIGGDDRLVHCQQFGQAISNLATFFKRRKALVDQKL